MKKTISCMLFLLLTAPSWSEEYIDVVYLKNGCIIKGIIIEQIPGQSIKVKTPNGNIFSIKVEEIVKLAKEEKTPTLTVEKHYGSIRVIAKAPGDLFLDGVLKGKLPANSTGRIDDVEAGQHEVAMKYDEGAEEVLTVHVTKDKTTAVYFDYTGPPKIDMVLAKEYGSLEVETGQAGSLFVDGEFLMDVPAQSKFTIENLGVGERTIEIRYKDGTKELETVEIKKDETQLISFVKPEIKEKPTIVEVKAVAAKEFGNLVVTTAQAGSLFVDGEQLRDIPANGKFTVENLEVGEHTVEMRYAGNKTEVKTVQVTKDEVQEVSFIEVLIAEEAGPARMQRHHFTIGVGAGLTVPVGDVGEIMQLAYYPIAFFNYNLSFQWGVIGFGILSGINIQSTKTDVKFQYDLLSIPIAAKIKYSTNFDFPLYGFVEVDGGIAVNKLMYKETYASRSNVTASNFFLTPTVGGGWYLMPELALSLYGSFLMIFFENSTYLAISPGLRFEFNF